MKSWLRFAGARPCPCVVPRGTTDVGRTARSIFNCQIPHRHHLLSLRAADAAVPLSAAGSARGGSFCGTECRRMGKGLPLSQRLLTAIRWEPLSAAPKYSAYFRSGIPCLPEHLYYKIPSGKMQERIFPNYAAGLRTCMPGGVFITYNRKFPWKS